MLRLFFENKELELDSNVEFAITSQFEDIINPTAIINSWSKTVKIPRTAVNNNIFGQLYNIDRLIVEGDYKLMGIYFNPYKKIDFRLQWADCVVMTGYAKNISVDKDCYNITLNGELGKIFQEMKKITFDKTTEENDYLIDGGKYVNEIINKDLIYKLWSNVGGNNTTLYNTDDSNYNVVDILGFVPNNSYDEDFEYTTYQVDSKTSKKFTETLDEKAGGSYVNITGITADDVIGDGLLPREIGEFRSYLQTPYIYFNKLFQIFNQKSEELTGYKAYLHPSWFNDDNPYWSKLVYMLDKIDISEEVVDSVELYTSNILFSQYRLNNSGGEILAYPNTYIPRIDVGEYTTFSDAGFNELKSAFRRKEIDSIRINSQKIPVKLTISNPINYNNNEVGNSSDIIIFGETTRLYVDFRLTDENDNVVANNRTVVVGENYNGGTIISDNIVKVSALQNTSNRTWEVAFNVDLSMIIDRNTVCDDFNLEISAYFNPNLAYLFFLNSENNINNRLVCEKIQFNVIPNFKYTTSENNSIKRSDSNFTLNDLWNNEFNLFDEILNYCKQYRISVSCDYVNKRINFIPLSEYFKDFVIKDWTAKIDYTRDYHIEPITFQNKYILFNYEDYQTELNKTYNEKYGLNFGEYRLTTNYEFNNETHNLFEYGKSAITFTDSILSWGNIYDDLNVIYTLPAEINVDNRDKDKKYMSVFGSMLFYKGLGNFDTTSGLRGVFISDDTSLQSLNNTFFYTQDGDEDKRVRISTYPLLDVNYSNNLCCFAKPVENFTYLSDNYDNTYGIYNNFWQNYINERYNIQNKIVTCYVYLKPDDYINFKWNNLIKINNQLFAVNKIYDYSVSDSIPTKVDLITVQDISGYTDSNFKLFDIYVKSGDNYMLYNGESIELEQHSYYTLYVTANSNIEWQTDDGLQLNVEVNGELGGGVIQSGSKVAVHLYNDEFTPSDGYIEFSNERNIHRIFVKVK